MPASARLWAGSSWRVLRRGRTTFGRRPGGQQREAGIGDTAPRGAGVIYSDTERGFICAETISWQDFVRLGGWPKAREVGLARQEGKEYVVADGDVRLFKFNV